MQQRHCVQHAMIFYIRYVIHVFFYICPQPSMVYPHNGLWLCFLISTQRSMLPYIYTTVYASLYPHNGLCFLISTQRFTLPYIHTKVYASLYPHNGLCFLISTQRSMLPYIHTTVYTHPFLHTTVNTVLPNPYIYTIIHTTVYVCFLMYTQWYMLFIQRRTV